MTNIAMYTGLSGMIAHARRLDVIGNNIANANTTAFKSSRTLFADQFSWNVDRGTPPLANTGGTNGTQIGLGVDVSATQRNFNTGSLTLTGRPGDLAIEGRGLFVVDRNGEQLFTRDGAFSRAADNTLINAAGDQLLGWGVDAGFNINRGALGPISIPIGTLSFAEATTATRLAGNLKSDGEVATRGSRTSLGATTASGFRLIPGATIPPAAPNVLEERSLLTEIADPLSPAAALFQAGQTIEVAGAERGVVEGQAGVGKEPLRTARFTVRPGTTVQNLMDFLRDALAINTRGGANPDGQTPGVSLDRATGRLNINGNTGTINDLFIDNTDLRVLDASGQFVRNAFVAEKAAAATGESIRTSFIAYDSLGGAVNTNVGLVLVSRDLTGTRWRYEAGSPSNPGTDQFAGSGELRFDNLGQLQSDPTASITLDRAGTGAASPQNLTLRFAEGTGGLTALARTKSSLSARLVDGAPPGTLANYGVDRDGTVIGAFDNGQTRVLGQVAVATVNNFEGLTPEGDTLYRTSANSGTPRIVVAGTAGTGEIQGGSLEQSNVDLSREFIDLIQTSTGYSASSRVIRTADELLQQLMVLGR